MNLKILNLYMFLLLCITCSAQSKYKIKIKNDCCFYETSNLNSKQKSVIKKNNTFIIDSIQNDFVYVENSGFLHKSCILIYKFGLYESEKKIQIIEKKLYENINDLYKSGLNLNKGQREYIELPIRDTLSFDKIKN